MPSFPLLFICNLTMSYLLHCFPHHLLHQKKTSNLLPFHKIKNKKINKINDVVFTNFDPFIKLNFKDKINNFSCV